MDIFAHTVRPDMDTALSIRDPSERTMGEAVRVEEGEYGAAQFVLLGSPQDIGVRRNKGRAGAAAAPGQIRRRLYAFPAPRGLGRKLFDLGDVRIGETLEETHAVQRGIVRRVLGDGKRMVILGGGNDISYPDVAGLSEVVSDVLVFNVDSHFDVRDSGERHSGTPYRQLLEEGLVAPERFYQMAGKVLANAPAYADYLKEWGVVVYPLEELRRQGIEELFLRILGSNPAEAVFWGFDLDAVRANDAPGVSAPNPVGLTAEEVCTIARLAGRERRTRVVELSEVNPRYDVDGRTARLSSMMVLTYLQEAVA